ncbi:MAG TPA: TolC family protein [Puia sp.]|nr:TolC family protein [Puia sp.]
MNRIVFFLFCVLMTKEVVSQQVTLDSAIIIAMRNSPSLAIFKNVVDIAGINNNYGIAGGLPVVQSVNSVNEQLTSLEQRYSNPLNNKNSKNASSNQINAGIAATLPLYAGGRIVNEKNRLGIVESQTQQQYTSRVQTLIYNVMLKYYDIVRQQEYAKTLEASIKALRQRLEIVKQQQNVGVANDADLFQSQVDLNTQLQSLIAQQLVIDQDKTDLLTLMVLNPDSAITVKDTIIVDKNIQLDSILNAAYQNPDIQAAYQQIQINQYIEKEVGSYRYPSVSANLGYNFSHTSNPTGFNTLNQQYGPYLGLGLTIPIFNGGIYKRQQQIAGINVNTARLQKDTLMLNVHSTAVKNWQAYLNNLKQLETAKQNYDLSQKLLNLVLMKFNYKAATIVDVTLAQQSFESAGFQLVNVNYAAKASEIQLRRLANQLP